jgi:DNA-binding NarL/FixJ family response regulator
MHILVADHHKESLWALKTSLEEEPGMSLVGEACEAETLLELAQTQPVDLVLVDGELPGAPIDSLVRQLHGLKPGLKIVVMGSNPEFSRKYLRAGADAFVSKGDQPEWLLETLRRLMVQSNQEKNHS